MPELPEVETIARGLGRVLCGRIITKAALKTSSLYRGGSLPVEILVGKEITAVERFGKAVLFRFENPGPASEAGRVPRYQQSRGAGRVPRCQQSRGAGRVPRCQQSRGTVMVVHLGMTGSLIVAGGELEPEGAGKHLHAVFLFAGGGELRYYDPRRFGFFFLGAQSGLAETLNIGPDPFQIKPKALARILHNRKAPIKSLLLNQRIISGLGNIYVDEALFRAGLHPLTRGGQAAGRARELLKGIRAVLERAIRHGGTTFRDYRKHDGSRGDYQRRLAVYGREGERCRKCGGNIKRIVLGGRSTHFCPRCQKRKPARLNP